MPPLSQPNSCLRLIILVLAIFVWPLKVSGDATEFYSQRTRFLAEQSFQVWQRVSTSHLARASAQAYSPSRSIRDSKLRAAVRQEALAAYLSQVVPAMRISPEVAHIPKEHPVSVTDDDGGESANRPSRNWVRYYDLAKSSLRPHVKYHWKSNASRDEVEIKLSEVHVETIQENFDVVMWYRQKLDEQCPGREHAGARYLRMFLDSIVADLLDGMPTSPRIRLGTGTLSVPDWELDERNLRDQLVMAYRYFVAKYLTYPEYEDFAAADRETLMSLMKIGCLLGCRLDYVWFEEREVRLNRYTEATRWKKAVANALAVLEVKGREQELSRDQQELSPARYEHPCVIRIPPPKPKEKPKPPPQPKPKETKIEIIVRPKP